MSAAAGTGAGMALGAILFFLILDKIEDDAPGLKGQWAALEWVCTVAFIGGVIGWAVGQFMGMVR